MCRGCAGKPLINMGPQFQSLAGFPLFHPCVLLGTRGYKASKLADRRVAGCQCLERYVSKIAYLTEVRSDETGTELSPFQSYLWVLIVVTG